MNWYIGQEVICIDAKGAQTSNGEPSGLTEGKIYTIQAIALACCNTVVLDVGIPSRNKTYRCPKCRRANIPDVTIGWGFHERRFVPVADISELEELLKERTQLSL